MADRKGFEVFDRFHGMEAERNKLRAQAALRSLGRPPWHILLTRAPDSCQFKLETSAHPRLPCFRRESKVWDSISLRSRWFSTW
jgi:hypothetical protein